ncbi:MAG: ATP-binding cassette domain-containing protein, partial [Chloroflexi bacterium]|nr:ATP-binding cassette domain-containing protein [Chloroflexota bacterium]
MTDNFVQTINLRKTYKMGDNEVHALDGLDLSIPSGSFTVIMGPSGSGKSTLLYIVGGLDWPTSGNIIVDGTEIEKMDENALADYRRNKIGFIFQSFNLVANLTAEANVAFPLRFSGVKKKDRIERAENLMVKVGLEDRIGHRPTELS